MNKESLRTHFKAIRGAISNERRMEASEKVFLQLKALSARFRHILSFSPIHTEIDLHRINHFWQRQNKLHFWEEKILPLEKIDCVIVPGLAFDLYGTRLGYGKGHYDKFLPLIPSAFVIGVGFKEQLSFTPLPKELHDKKLTQVFLF